MAAADAGLGKTLEAGSWSKMFNDISGAAWKVAKVAVLGIGLYGLIDISLYHNFLPAMELVQKASPWLISFYDAIHLGDAFNFVASLIPEAPAVHQGVANIAAQAVSGASTAVGGMTLPGIKLL